MGQGGAPGPRWLEAEVRPYSGPWCAPIVADVTAAPHAPHNHNQAEDNIFDSSLIRVFEMGGSAASRGGSARAPSCAPLAPCPTSGSAARAGTVFLR